MFQKGRSAKEDEIIAAAYVNPSLHQGSAFKLMLDDIQRTDPNCREFFAKQLETQQWVNELQLIQNFNKPLLYILGEDDGFINSSLYRDFLIGNGIAASQIHLLKNARHMPQLDNPRATAQLIGDVMMQIVAKHET